MNVPVGILLLMCGTFIFQSETTCAKSAETQRLLDDLIMGYNIYVRPNADLYMSGPVVVTFGITINALLVEDARQGYVKAHGYLDLSWTDKRLAWNPLEYGNISMMRIPSDRIWLPDIRLYNSLDARNSMYAVEKPLAIVSSNGTVQYVPPVTLALDCTVTDNLFTGLRATVSCKAMFGSWSYDGHHIDFKPNSNQRGGRGHSTNHFQLTESSVTRESKNCPRCPEPYPSITVTFKAQKVY